MQSATALAISKKGYFTKFIVNPTEKKQCLNQILRHSRICHYRFILIQYGKKAIIFKPNQLRIVIRSHENREKEKGCCQSLEGAGLGGLRQLKADQEKDSKRFKSLFIHFVGTGLSLLCK